MTILYWLDLIGVFVFAMSGTLTAIDKKLDWFGAVFIGFITAVGGGTLRDMIIGSYPVAWVSDLNYLICIGAGALTALTFQKPVRQLRRTLFLFDSIGIGVFTVLGLQKGLSHDIAPAVAVIFGMMSAVFGGVIRDTLCNDIPLIFRKEIYATACIVGGLVYLLLLQLGVGSVPAIVTSVALTIAIRLLSVRFQWALPSTATDRTNE